MAKMNWDRVRRERNLPDYSERMDQADERLEGTSELPDPMNGVGERPVPPAAPRHLRLNDSADGVWRIVAGRRTRVSAKRARVIDEAARLGITEAEVTARWRRQAPPKRRNLSESAASTASTSTKPSGPAGGRDPAPPRPPRNRTTSFSRPGTGVSPEAVARMRAGAVSRIGEARLVRQPKTKKPQRTKNPRGGTKADGKRQRAVETAARRGITVEQLRAERQAKAAADLELAAHAKELGITTKELRARLAAPPRSV